MATTVTPFLVPHFEERPLCPPSSPLPTASLNLRTRIVKGRKAVVEMHPLLIEMSARFGQPGAMDHLDHFVTSETALKKTPHLVLVGLNLDRPAESRDTMSGIVGAMLIYEYKALGRGTGIFATDDTTGRRTLVAPVHARAQVTKLAVDALLRAGARVVLQSLIELPEETLQSTRDAVPSLQGGRWIFATRKREIPSYMALEETMDATLGRMGQHTRRNLRYYRRRAEGQLGASFVRDARIDQAAFLDFNRRCAYAVSDEAAERRYDGARRMRGMFLCGIADRHGQWLSLLGGRRYEDIVEVDWQMNRSDLAASSLSTVMRAFFIEDEIGRGTRKMFLEGGTPHAMRYSFAVDTVRDLVVVRRGWLSGVVRGLWSVKLLRSRAARMLPRTNFVLDVLMHEGLGWRVWS